MMLRFLWVVLLLAASACNNAGNLPAVHDGDIIFQTSRSSQSLAIQKATNSPYSHMGIILFKKGQPFVFEAAATVRYTPLAEWIARGQDGRFVLKRLAKTPSPATIERMHAIASTFEGKPYDLTFEWSDRRIYCSELVWKLYQRATGIEIGNLQLLRDFQLSDPAVQSKLKERYGDQIPLDEPVISPAAMFQSEYLQVVDHN